MLPVLGATIVEHPGAVTLPSRLQWSRKYAPLLVIFISCVTIATSIKYSFLDDTVGYWRPVLFCEMHPVESF
jgi:hypothetical protein